MLRKSVFAFLTGLTVILDSAAFADEPLRLPPSSPWQIDYADDSCRLTRQFGDGEERITIVMDRFQPVDYFSLMIVGEPLDRARPGLRRGATLRFGAHEGEQELPFFKATIGDQPTIIFSQTRIAPYSDDEEDVRVRLMSTDQFYLFEPDPISAEREQAADHLYLAAPGIEPILLETGSLGPPFATLDRCADELLTHWGIDVEKHRSLTREVRPVESPGRWLTSMDYPIGMIRRGGQGLVYFRLNVNSDGTVSECHVQQKTRPEGFEEVVCNALTQRARFEPALDAEGNPIASYYVGSARFEMPR